MKLRWGIIGAGRVCGDFALALGTLEKEQHEIGAVAARSLEKAKSFAEKSNANTAYGSYKELCQDASIHVVYIGTINTTHKELAILALSHGKHVLCEKPVTMNGNQLKEVLACAKEKKLFFMEAMWTRFFPLYQELQQNIANDEIGRPLSAVVTFGFKGLSNNIRVTSRDLGGSPLLDVGVYAINFSDFIFNGEIPEKVVATGHLLENGIDHSIGVTLLYKDKRISQLLISAVCDLPNEAVVAGEKGQVTVKSRFWCPTEIEYRKNDTSRTDKFPLPELQTYFPNSAGMRYEAIHVRNAILAGQTESEVMTHSTSLRIMNIMDEIRQQMGVRFDADKH